MAERARSAFDTYKRRLIDLHKVHGQIRMIVIEYLCKFPNIDPIKMAGDLIANGYNVVFDDTSISTRDNQAKQHEATKYANLINGGIE